VFKEDPQFTDAFIKTICNQVNDFFAHIYSCYKDKKVPIHFIRFEELRSNPKPVLDNLFKFLLNVDSLEGTVAEARINEVLDLGHEATQLYKVKDHDSKTQFNRNIDRFPEWTKEYIAEHIYDYN